MHTLYVEFERLKEQLFGRVASLPSTTWKLLPVPASSQLLGASLVFSPRIL